MTVEPVRIERTERLLNLVLCLMATRRAVARSDIHASVPGYGPVASGPAFERMFERDKDELRGMGIPVETVFDAHGDIEGYRIARDQYALPPLDFTSAELAVIALAAGVWDEAILGPSATTALRKIEAVQGEPARTADDTLVRVQVSAADAALPRHGEESIPGVSSLVRAAGISSRSITTAMPAGSFDSRASPVPSR